MEPSASGSPQTDTVQIKKIGDAKLKMRRSISLMLKTPHC
ncbi:hypothetical protein PSP31121_01599 [Pandoraea sputorum]|uniref:Uncharacterized protein n=1 Tax=Pandoraea sputorum TaxID=93222 RepID=A0A5E5AWU5_9BURK|nr:hypothetical protein PSP31121_01599 [Pandoraea sputorum]